MGLIITLVAGRILGWLASTAMRTDTWKGMFLDIGAGVAGAFLGSFLAKMSGVSADLSSFHPIGLAWAVMGALALLGLLSLFHRGGAR